MYRTMLMAGWLCSFGGILFFSPSPLRGGMDSRGRFLYVCWRLDV